jgi:hypothetical protein
MRSTAIALGALLAVAALCAASASAAEDVVLRPRFRAGDTYALSLRVSTRTDGVSSGESGESVAEDVRLAYAASVMVLEVDGDGRAVRERHEDVRLTFERPGDSGSLFKPGVAYEVRRKDGIEVSLGGRRAEPRVEKTVAEILEKQFEHTLEPALLEPGRPVEVGESWEPDPSLTKRFLLSRGIRVIALGDGATATLLREQGEHGASELVVEYAIPIARFALRTMPERAEATRSSARLEGRVRLGDAPGRPAAATFSSLTIELGGVLSGAAQPVPWSLRSTETVEKLPAPADVASPGASAH